MGRIATAAARQLAIDRMIEVMQAEYANEIADAVTEFEQTPGQLANLQTPAPDPEAYYYTQQEPDDEDAEPIAHNVAVFFSPDSPREALSIGSGGPQGRTEIRQWQLACVVTVRKDLGEAIHRNGKELSTNERLKLRTEVYTGGLITCLQKYGCTHNEIHDLELIDDDAGLLFAQDTLYGVGGAVFQITQKTLAPRRQALP